MLVAIHQGADEKQKTLSAAGLVLAAIFGTLASFNYVMQLTYVSALRVTIDPNMNRSFRHSP
jgi:hypothetical protein